VKFDAGGGVAYKDVVVAFVAHGDHAVVSANDAPVGGESRVEEVKNAAFGQEVVKLIAVGNNGFVWKRGGWIGDFEVVQGAGVCDL